jgi:hypothetical protein
VDFDRVIYIGDLDSELKRPTGVQAFPAARHQLFYVYKYASKLGGMKMIVLNC